jgi:alpha-galactosidase
MKVSILGAGSSGFGERMVNDVLWYPELRGATVSLMDLDPDRLSITRSLADRIVASNGLPTRIEATTDRRQSLRGADHVIVVFEAGGKEAFRTDVEVPLRHGVNQAIGCTMGPAGVFRALRAVPVLLSVVRDMEELCPGAVLYNYHNPQAVTNRAMREASPIRSYGICHSVQGTAGLLADWIGAPASEVSYWVAGINHAAWFLEFRWKGADALPLVAERIRAMRAADPRHAETVRFEIFQKFGYFFTEGSAHFSDYVPYFRRTEADIRKYKVPYALEHQDREREDRVKIDEAKRAKARSGAPIPLVAPSEYPARIIHAIAAGEPFTANLNVPNTGLITNLPPRAIVEVPCLIDGTGVHPCFVGDLPPQCAALNQTNLNVHELAWRAAVAGDREALYQAVSLDPLTAATIGLDAIRTMVDEMLDAEAAWLPQFRR